MRRIIGTVTLAALIAAPVVPVFAGNTTDVGVVAAAASEMASWFKSLVGVFSELSDEADRGYLIDNLIEVNDDLFDLQHEKENLILALQRRKINLNEVRRLVQASNRKVDDLRKSTGRLGGRIRLQHRQGGEAVNRALSKALGERKMWLAKLEDGRLSEVERQGVIRGGKAAVEQLAQAGASLAELIDKLQQL
jgi:hypothetical protein